MITVAVLNLKGGVGKTTTAVNLAYELSRHSRGVVLADMDAQGNATEFYGQYKAGESCPAGDVLRNRSGVQVEPALGPAGKEWERLSILTANMSLAVTNNSVLLEARAGRELRLVKWLQSPAANQFEWSVIDCPPAINMASINALMAADLVLVPVTLDDNAVKGLHETMEQIRASIESGGKCKFARVLVTRCRPDQMDKLNAAKQGLEGLKPMETVIRESTRRVEDSNDARLPVSVLSRWSHAARDFRSLAEEIRGMFA